MRVYEEVVETVVVARGTITVFVDVVGNVVVYATSTSEKEVTEIVVVAAVGTWVTKTVDNVERESMLVVAVSTSSTVLTLGMEVVVV